MTLNDIEEVKKEISFGLQDLGLRRGGVLLVHSSLRSLGKVPGGAESVIQALLAVVGDEGTLLFPALSYMDVNAHSPVFDQKNTPSCVGALPEYFRTRPGTLRSVHPTHSVSGVGRLAGELLVNHTLDHTPCGSNSPFSRLPQVGGQILFIGCGLNPNTSMHAIEEHIEPPYLYGEPVDYHILLADGSETFMRVRRHNFANTHQRYDRLEGVMNGEGLRCGRVLKAACHLVDAEKMWPAALAAYQSDPLYFVERDE